MTKRGGPHDDELPTVVDMDAEGELRALRAELNASLVEAAPVEAEEPTGSFPEGRLPSSVRAPDLDRVPSAILEPPTPSRSLGVSLPPPLDLAEALGVAEPPPEPAPPEPRRVEASADEIDVARFLGKPSKAEPERKEPTRGSAPADGVSVERLARLSQSSDALARALPIVLSVMVLFATAFVFVSLFGGPRTSAHLRLELLGAAGLPPPQAGAGTLHVVIETEPDGVLVFYGQQIIGKTPCEGELPVDIPARVGVRLHGPDFEDWVAELPREPGGEIVVRAELRRRPR